MRAPEAVSSKTRAQPSALSASSCIAVFWSAVETRAYPTSCVIRLQVSNNPCALYSFQRSKPKRFAIGFLTGFSPPTRQVQRVDYILQGGNEKRTFSDRGQTRARASAAFHPPSSASLRAGGSLRRPLTPTPCPGGSDGVGTRGVYLRPRLRQGFSFACGVRRTRGGVEGEALHGARMPGLHGARMGGLHGARTA